MLKEHSQSYDIISQSITNVPCLKITAVMIVGEDTEINVSKSLNCQGKC